jgi:hypothetical protein
VIDDPRRLWSRGRKAQNGSLATAMRSEALPDVPATSEFVPVMKRAPGSVSAPRGARQPRSLTSSTRRSMPALPILKSKRGSLSWVFCACGLPRRFRQARRRKNREMEPGRFGRSISRGMIFARPFNSENGPTCAPITVPKGRYGQQAMAAVRR